VPGLGWGVYIFSIFSIERAKLLISRELLVFDLVSCPQNIGNKEVARKIFRDKDLGANSRGQTPR